MPDRPPVQPRDLEVLITLTHAGQASGDIVDSDTPLSGLFAQEIVSDPVRFQEELTRLAEAFGISKRSLTLDGDLPAGDNLTQLAVQLEKWRTEDRLFMRRGKGELEALSDVSARAYEAPEIVAYLEASAYLSLLRQGDLGGAQKLRLRVDQTINSGALDPKLVDAAMQAGIARLKARFHAGDFEALATLGEWAEAGLVPSEDLVALQKDAAAEVDTMLWLTNLSTTDQVEVPAVIEDPQQFEHDLKMLAAKFGLRSDHQVV